LKIVLLLDTDISRVPDDLSSLAEVWYLDGSSIYHNNNLGKKASCLTSPQWSPPHPPLEGLPHPCFGWRTASGPFTYLMYGGPEKKRIVMLIIMAAEKFPFCCRLIWENFSCFINVLDTHTYLPENPLSLSLPTCASHHVHLPSFIGGHQ
jgi:hypothetical protein